MIPDDLAADVAAVVDARLADRLAVASRTREAARADRARRAAARTAGLAARHRQRLDRLEAGVSDDLRKAVADLDPRARSALREQSEQAARKWSGTLPGLGTVWGAFAAFVGDVEQLDRARRAAERPEDTPTLRPARRSRK